MFSRCLASLSSSKAPTWIIQPPLRLAETSAVEAVTGTLSPAEATLLAGSTPSTPGLAPGGGGSGPDSALTVATVVTFPALAVADDGASFRLSGDGGDSDAVRAPAARTVKGLTGFGLIGSVETGWGWRGRAEPGSGCCNSAERDGAGAKGGAARTGGAATGAATGGTATTF